MYIYGPQALAEGEEYDLPYIWHQRIVMGVIRSLAAGVTGRGRASLPPLPHPASPSKSTESRGKDRRCQTCSHLGPDRKTEIPVTRQVTATRLAAAMMSVLNFSPAGAPPPPAGRRHSRPCLKVNPALACSSLGEVPRAAHSVRGYMVSSSICQSPYT